jgi:hypothetical protein
VAPPGPFLLDGRIRLQLVIEATITDSQNALPRRAPLCITWEPEPFKALGHGPITHNSQPGKIGIDGCVANANFLASHATRNIAGTRVNRGLRQSHFIARLFCPRYLQHIRSDGVGHQAVLEKKLNTHLAFVELKAEILEQYSKAKNRPVPFKVFFRVPPDDSERAFAARAREVIESAGFTLPDEVFLSWPVQRNPPAEANKWPVINGNSDLELVPLWDAASWGIANSNEPDHAAIANHRRISARGTMPVRSAMMIPLRKSTKYGIDRTRNWAASVGHSSVLTLRTKPRPAISRASSWTSGAAIRQGPHQAAQKSTRTGTLASRVISANAVASTSIGSETGGKAALHDPQRPVSERCFAGTRLFAPQAGHGRIMCTL